MNNFGYFHHKSHMLSEGRWASTTGSKFGRSLYSLYFPYYASDVSFCLARYNSQWDKLEDFLLKRKILVTFVIRAIGFLRGDGLQQLVTSLDGLSIVCIFPTMLLMSHSVLPDRRCFVCFYTALLAFLFKMVNMKLNGNIWSHNVNTSTSNRIWNKVKMLLW